MESFYYFYLVMSKVSGKTAPQITKAAAADEQSDLGQTLPIWLRQLSNEEILGLASYRHSADKTSYEVWLREKICEPLEPYWPEFLSANTLTIIGQAPLQILILLVFWSVGPNIDAQTPITAGFLALGAVFTMWFSVIDIMDGLRARRLKVGSPLGRLIDEGGDTLTMGNYSVLMAYVWNLQIPGSELVFFSMNFVFYMMEIKYIITGALVMSQGDISDVEFELVFSIVMLIHVFTGRSFYEDTVAQTLGISSEA